MKSKFLLPLIICCISLCSSSLSAQCYAYFTYSQSAASVTDVIFYVDSVSNTSNHNTYTWSFGDGTAGSGSQLVHQYHGAHTSYTVCLTMHDTIAGCTFTTCDTIHLITSPTCSTVLSYTSVDSVFSFIAHNVGIGHASYAWTVNGQPLAGSGTTNTVTLHPNSAPSHVCVTATDSTGCVSSDCAIVFDSAHAHTCSAYASFTHVGTTYTFSASHTGGTPVSYEWYQDNTLLGTTPGVHATIDSTDLAHGVSVCVNITDARGCVSSDCITLHSTPTGGGGCQAYFQIYPDSANGNSGYYSGINLSSGSFGSNVLWNFGDGTTSASPYPTHTYSTPGTYIVCLTVGTAGTSCYDTYCDSSFYVFKTASGPMTHLSISGPTGITEATTAAVSFYPNPVSDKLTVTNVNNIDYERIYNINGQLVQESKATGNVINVSKLSAGIYIMELSANGANSRAKFVKE